MAPKRKHDAEDEDLTDWASLTVPKLKAELVQRGLPVSGKKAALIDRLNSDDRSGNITPSHGFQATRMLTLALRRRCCCPGCRESPGLE